MKISRDTLKKSKAIAVVCILAIIITSTFSVSVVVYASEKAYMNIYTSTVEEVYDVAEEGATDDFIEYEVSGLDNGVSEEEGEIVMNDTNATVASFSWNVSKNTVNKSTGFKVAEGDTITVISICRPSTETIRIGIIEPDGVRRYVSGTKMLSHIFS